MLFIIVSEKVEDCYSLVDTPGEDIYSPDVAIVMFNNLLFGARDYTRTHKEVALWLMRILRVLMAVLILKYFGGEISFEGSVIFPFTKLNRKNAKTFPPRI